MDLLGVIQDKVEPDYIGGAVDKSETRVQKRIKVFSEQICKGVSDMQVRIYSHSICQLTF